MIHCYIQYFLLFANAVFSVERLLASFPMRRRRRIFA